MIFSHSFTYRICSKVSTCTYLPKKMMMYPLTKNRLKLSNSKALSSEIKVLYFFDLQLWPRGKFKVIKSTFLAEIARKRNRREKKLDFRNQLIKTVHSVKCRLPYLYFFSAISFFLAKFTKTVFLS